ncbi:MAG TPA: SMC family ATPase [Anaerolineae bacterium]|nr:SMC family ATPase [Anaerolineae bacterium]
MRPTNLSMSNFMPYADAELDLSSLHLACLAGENGHGKSAIIDAITWALWGKARARRDDELIRLGEEQMEVRLDFLLGDQRYRVIRQRDSSGRGNSTLEFQVGGNGQWSALSGSAIRETQTIINETLSMDYDTFINSALLLQGRADEFTNQPPGKRKEILGEILRLHDWDDLEERAKIRAREAQGAASAIEAKAQSMDEELEKLPAYEAELEEASERAELIGGEIDEAQGSLDRKKEQVTELSFKQQALADVEGEGRRRREELESLRRRIEHPGNHLGADLGLVQDQITGYQKEAAEITQRMIGFHPVKLESCRAKVAAVRSDLAGMADLADKRKAHEQEIGHLSAEKASLTATNTRLREDMDALKEEMALLERAGAACPLCDSELTDEHRQEILSGKQAEGKAKADEYRKNKEIIEEDDNELSAWQQALREIETELNRERLLRQQESEGVALVAKLEAEQERLEEWSAQVEKLKESIREAKDRHETMKAERIAEWEGEAAKLEETVGELRTKSDALRLELAGADELTRAMGELQAQIQRLDLELNHVRQKVGGAQQKLDHCQYLEKEKAKLEQQHAEASSSSYLYEQLKLAFGKRGIQAMIIETVLPEIEEGANELLGRMTDGRMSVQFESQRETKAGTISETLDIQVGDELGTRSYDLFSGGERYRLDFAIRIAISQLLARRAGARLETLILDEGFGSQDAAGRERLVEAINSIQGDFGLVLVVTHIEELKEQFPARIEVVKGPAGSVVSVN